ncbi:unnamed protein product, partial [Hymenolepis diminuta]
SPNFGFDTAPSSTEKCQEYASTQVNFFTPVVPFDEQLLHETSAVPEHTENLSATLISDLQMEETSKVLAGPGDHLDAEWEMEIEPTLSAGKKPLAGGFLVSFLVDARGGLLESKRYPGLRFIIPPNASIGPLRIICRLLRYPSYAVQPPLNDGEGLACRLIEVGPVGVRFNSPILFEVPYCASVRGNQREIIVLRSENGEVWKEHPVDNTDQAVQDSLGAYFADAIPSTELKKRRVHRILTNSIPQYFALVTRTRQDLILVGPDGCTLTSTVDPRVKVTFPRGALQKKIRVGLQVQTVDHRLVEACLGSPRFAVSPIVTIEPRRRKFHRPIVVFIPLPKVAGKGEHQGGGKNQTPDLSTVRLLCSITGGTAQAIWEDITGSSPFSLQKDCVSFTTTVSARLWLIDCPNLSEISEMAARVYREATAVPYLGRFVVYARRHHPEESHVRCVCLTDDTEQKTLECQEGFEVIARSGSGSGDAADDSGLVEFLHNRSVWVETAGNLVPVSGIATSTPLTHEENGASPAADQLRFPVVRAFEENRLNTILRIKDVNSPPVGQLAFMPQQRQPGVDTVNPLCVLDVTLPRMAPSMIQEQNEKGLEESVANFFNGTSQNNDLIDSIARSDLDLKKVADNLGSDWPRVAPFLGLSEQDVSSIRDNEMDSDYKMALTCLTLWQERNGSAATGTALSQALKRADREDVIRQSMQNVSLVQHDPELSYALHSLEVIDGASATTNAASKESPTEKFMHVKSTVAEPVAVAVDDGIAENVITPIEISPQPHPEAESVTDTDREELKAALEVLVQQLEESADDGLSLLPDVPPTDVGDDMGVEEEELVPEIVHPGIKLESAVPAFIQEEIEREATGTTTSSPSHPNEPLDLDDIATAGDAQPNPSLPMPKKTRIALREEDNNVIEVLPGSPLKQDQQNLATTFQEFSPPSSLPPEPSVGVDSPLHHSAPYLPPAPHSPSSLYTHLSITRSNIDPSFRPPSPPPQIPPHLKELQVSPAASTETFRADFETQEGSSLLSNVNDNDPIISGEFVLIRQTIDDSNSPKVKQDTQMMIPVPLHATTCLGDGPLIGPGVCRVTTECRQQTLLDGHFRLRRSGANPSRHERLVRTRTDEVEGSEMVPPEPPQRTTSLRSSTSTLASFDTQQH